MSVPLSMFGGVAAVRAIVSRAADISGCSEHVIRGAKRGRDLSMIRFAIYHAARETTRASYQRIAAVVGRDHSTVIHGERRALELLAIDPEFADFCRRVRGR